LLGDDAQDSAACDRHGAVVDAAIATQRRADEQNRAQRAARLCHHRHRRLARGEHGVLKVEVVDRIAGEAELGKDKQVGARPVALAGKRDRRFGIGVRVGDAHGRRADAGADHPLMVERVEGMGARHRLISRGVDIDVRLPSPGWTGVPTLARGFRSGGTRSAGEARRSSPCCAFAARAY